MKADPEAGAVEVEGPFRSRFREVEACRYSGDVVYFSSSHIEPLLLGREARLTSQRLEYVERYMSSSLVLWATYLLVYCRTLSRFDANLGLCIGRALDFMMEAQ